VSGDDKRAHERFALWMPVKINAQSGRMEAVCRDASSGGILVAGSVELNPGDPVTITLPKAAEDGSDLFILGKIVRIDEADASGTRRAAIEFLHPVPALAALFEGVASRPPPPA
jgi:hypothetical protein